MTNYWHTLLCVDSSWSDTSVCCHHCLGRAMPMIKGATNVRYASKCSTSGKSLGGHKRSHLVNPEAAVILRQSPGRCCNNLNLLASLEDKDVSHVELSAVSHAEFVNRVRRWNWYLNLLFRKMGHHLVTITHFVYSCSILSVFSGQLIGSFWLFQTVFGYHVNYQIYLE